MVNKFLADGGSISGYEKANGHGKDTIRKRLKSLGFTYNRDTKQFSLTEVKQGIKQNTEKVKHEVIKSLTPAYNVAKTIEETDKMDLATFKNLSTIEQVEYVNQFADGTKSLIQIEKEHFTFTKIGSFVNRHEAFWDGTARKFVLIEPKVQLPFDDGEIEILKQIIELQKSKNKIESEKEDNPIIFAGLKCGEKTLNTFKHFCKDRDIKQQDAVTMALELFMQQFK